MFKKNVKLIFYPSTHGFPSHTAYSHLTIASSPPIKRVEELIKVYNNIKESRKTLQLHEVCVCVFETSASLVLAIVNMMQMMIV